MPEKNKLSMTNRAIARDVGYRIDQIRLELNISQKEIADKVGMTVKTYRNLIDGGGKFESIIAVLRVLDRLDLIDTFIPESTFSPLELVKMRGKQRLRASGRRAGTSGMKNREGELDW